MSLRQSNDKFQLPEPPVVMDVGCRCRTPSLLSSLVSSLKTCARRGLGGRGGKPKSPPPNIASSSAWSSSTATAAFTPSATSTTTASSSLLDASSWGLATYAPASAANNDALVYEAEAARLRRRRRRRRRTQRRSRLEQESSRTETAAAVAVELDSAAPYEDFRESMVAMVTEGAMYAWEDLNALLHQFLALNSPRHHPLILGAFADLWAPRAGPFCPPSPCLFS